MWAWVARVALYCAALWGVSGQMCSQMFHVFQLNMQHPLFPLFYVSFILVLFLLFVGVCSCIIRHRVFVLGQWGKAVRRITWRRVFQKCTNTWDASTSRPHLKELPPSSKRATFSRRLCSDSLGSNRETRLSSVFLILFMAKHKQLHF